MSNPQDSVPKWREWIQEIFSNGEAKESKSEFFALLETAAEAELFDSQAIYIFRRVSAIRDLKASDVMVPRALMTCVKINDGNKSLLEVLINNRHSRFPVIGDESDDVRGILHAKDLLPSLSESENFEDLEIKDIMRTPTLIPENKSLIKLLQEFRTSRNHMAIVVNEYSHVTGLVTIEDVLEQLVGDIEDEHDAKEKDERVFELEDGSFRVDPRISVVDFNEAFNSTFSNEDFDTIGGIVLHRFGYVPEVDDACEVDGFQFKVLIADSRRVHQLSVIRPA